MFNIVTGPAEAAEVHVPYCKECNRSFSHKWNLNRHMRRVHQGEKDSQAVPTLCTICNQVFANLSNYNRHVRDKHDIDSVPSSPPS